MFIFYDVVIVGDEIEVDGESDDSDLLEFDGNFFVVGLISVLGFVYSRLDIDSVINIVGIVSEGGSVGSDDLDEGV